MTSPAQAIVYQLLAAHLAVDEASIEDADTLDELGLDPLDLVLIVLRLEDWGGGEGDFPLTSLADARTVNDFVELVDLWLARDTMPDGFDATSRRSSAA